MDNKPFFHAYFKTFSLKDLVGKTLKIGTAVNNGVMLIVAREVGTDNFYVLGEDK